VTVESFNCVAKLGSRGLNLQAAAKVAGAWASGSASGTAKRALVRLVAGDVHFQQGARGDIQFEAAAAAVNQGAGGDHQAAFLFHDADGFARGAACGPDIFDYEDAFARLQFKTAAQGHLAGAVAFDEERADAERARDFISDENAAQRRRNDASDRMFLKKVGERAAQLFSVLRMFENQRALDVSGAVTSAGKFEVAGADRAYLFEKFYNFFAVHSVC